MNLRWRTSLPRRGLTLLELQLVLVLLAATGAMAIGSLSAADRANRTRLAESAIRELDELGRTWARTSGGARLTTDAHRTELLLLSESGERLASRPMPSGMTVRLVSGTGQLPWVWFDATAAASDYRAVFGDGPDRRWAVDIAGLTGLVHSKADVP